MITVEVSTRGLDLQEVDLGSVRQKLINRIADSLYAGAFFRAPWRTGALAQSIVKEVTNDSAVIDVVAPYAPFVVKGTAPHEIRPVRASCLAFEVAGETVFARLVRHPGTKPDPFLDDAKAEVLSQLPAFFREIFEEEFPE